MTISIIRQATSQDASSVKAAAERFCKRHGVDFGFPFDSTAVHAVEFETAKGSRLEHLRTNWTRAYCRALGFSYQDSRIVLHGDYVGLTCQ